MYAKNIAMGSPGATPHPSQAHFALETEVRTAARVDAYVSRADCEARSFVGIAEAIIQWRPTPYLLTSCSLGSSAMHIAFTLEASSDSSSGPPSPPGGPGARALSFDRPPVADSPVRCAERPLTVALPLTVARPQGAGCKQRTRRPESE